jgi:hypothetical protein
MIMHCWVSYKNEYDQKGEVSYYCDRCGIKIYTISDYVGNYPVKIMIPINDSVDGADYENISCEEYIIKKIIE